VTVKTLLLPENVYIYIYILLNYLFQRILTGMYDGFHKNIKQHNCFQHW